MHQVTYKKMGCIQLWDLSSCSMTGLAHAQTLTRPGENVCKEPTCEADPTYQGGSGRAWEESDLPRTSHMGPVIASSYRIAFANQLRMDKTRMICIYWYEPNWVTLPEASKVCCGLISCKCKKGCVKGCKCKKVAFECTVLYAYEGECCSQSWDFVHCTTVFSLICQLFKYCNKINHMELDHEFF